MSEYLARSLKDALQLDDESISHLVGHAQSLEGEELRKWLVDFLGNGPSVEEYLKIRYRRNEPTTHERSAQPQQARPQAPSSPRGPQALQGPSRNFISNGVWDPHQSRKQKKPAGSHQTTNKNQIKVESLSDIDSALKQLEISDRKRTKCNCMATRHPLLEVAPNCLNCGKIICVKEGPGPCTFCGKDLISSEQLSSINQVLKMEKEQLASSMGKKARHRAELETGTTLSSALKSAHSEAEERLNKLLEFQETSAQRTKIIDQVSDFETPGYGVNQWASPMEQAQQLKRQQRQLRKLEQARLSRQGRGRKVISIDIKGNKVYAKEEEAVSEEESDEEGEGDAKQLPSDSGTKFKSASWDPSQYGKNFIHPRAKQNTELIGSDKSKGRALEAGGVVDFGDDDSRALEL